jgi:hypothetical protein
MTINPKVVGCSLALSFFALIFLSPTIAMQIQSAYAGGKSPYESGYDHGCDDARISDPSDRYINQPEREPNKKTIIKIHYVVP